MQRRGLARPWGLRRERQALRMCQHVDIQVFYSAGGIGLGLIQTTNTTIAHPGRAIAA